MAQCYHRCNLSRILFVEYELILRMDGLVMLSIWIRNIMKFVWAHLANGQISTTWKDIKTAYTSQALQVQFTNAQIVEYFVTRTVSDGRRSADFKSINKSALNLFRCGHVQNIEISSDETNLYMQANCLPEMQKDRVYKLLLTMNRSKLL